MELFSRNLRHDDDCTSRATLDHETKRVADRLEGIRARHHDRELTLCQRVGEDREPHTVGRT
jgi:hypothetical protein